MNAKMRRPVPPLPSGRRAAPLALAGLAALGGAVLVSSCGDDEKRPMPQVDAAMPPVDAAPLPDAPNVATFCEIGTDAKVPKLPTGFCAREFASVKHPRAIAFAPNGDLFVSVPQETYVTNTGGGIGGILVLSDDNRDGKAEVHEFLKGVPDIHGIAVGGGYVHYTTRTTIFRTPYTVGQRAELPGQRQDLALPMHYKGERSTHPLARSVGGKLFSSRSMAPSCGNPIGEIYNVREDGSLGVMAKGFRNPMYIRCHFRDEVCAATELGDDGSPGAAREKLLFLSMGAAAVDYGYPGCHGPDLVKCGGVRCGGVAKEELSIPLTETPFGLDWERGLWPEPYRHGIFVGMHGSFYKQYEGAGVIFVPADPVTHKPTTGSYTMFVGGYGNTSVTNERPADVAFAPDGRLFYSVDQGNKIYWVAPTSLATPWPPDAGSAPGVEADAAPGAQP